MPLPTFSSRIRSGRSDGDGDIQEVERAEHQRTHSDEDESDHISKDERSATACDAQPQQDGFSPGFQDVEKEAANGAFPRRTTTFLPHSPPSARNDATIRRPGEGHGPELLRNRTLEATQSIGGLSLARASARQGLDPRPRVAAEFKTMSIQLSQGGLAAPTKSGKKQKSQAASGRQTTPKELAELNWHKLPIEEVFQRLGASPTLGLDDEQVKRRRDRDGLNKLSKPPNRWARKLFGYVFGGFGSILLGAAIIVFISWKPLGEPDPQVSVLALALVLIAVLLLQALFNAWQDFTTSRTMASIGSMLPSSVLVIRHGERVSIPAQDIVKGDVVVLGMGQRVAADVRFFSLDGEVKVDRSMLTGESDAIKCTVDKTDDNYLESRNIALMGTMCVSGSGGLALVTAIGDDTVFGRLAKNASKPRTGRTTLENEIFYFVLVISALAATLAIVCIIIWAAFLRPKHPDFMSVSQMLVNVVSVVVAFIPEGLPIAVTLSLTAIAAKMRKARVLAKSLSVVETLGAVNVICSDKTGTLTTNKMRVTSMAISGFESDDCSTTDALKHIAVGGPIGSSMKTLAWIAGVCNAASFAHQDQDMGGPIPLADRPINGDATDSACLRLSDELLGSVTEARAGWNTIANLAFNSKNKFAARIMQWSFEKQSVAAARDAGFAESEIAELSETNTVLLAKGAPDILFDRCSQVLDAGGEVVPLTPERRLALVDLQSQWAGQGQRVLVLARRIIALPNAEESLDDDFVLSATSDLTVIGLVGIVDPPRPEIPGVVATCRRAGARFFMVTGDFPKTAVAIARQCGIITGSTVYGFQDLSDSSLVLPEYSFMNDNLSRPQLALNLSGADLQKMETQHWDRACRFDEIVFARTTPEQKLRIVSEFQARDGVVSMSGDGANDSPALRQADVGVAIAGGSDIAMESADLVLLDSFSGFVDALLLGRLCFENLKKTLCYLLPAGSFSELWAILVAFFFGLPQSLNNLQMIFICVLTDLGPSLALINESPESDILKRRPRNVKTDRLADWKLLMQAYLFLGLPMTAFAMCMSYWYIDRSGISFSSLWLHYGSSSSMLAQSDPTRYQDVLYRGQSVYFFTLVLAQWGTLLIVRTRKLSIFQQPPFFTRNSNGNVYILPAMVLALSIAIFVSYIPGLQHVFATRGIPAEHFGLPIAYAVGMLAIDEGRKACIRRWPRGLLAKVSW